MFEYRAALVRVIDGDSAVLTIDLGFGVRQEAEVRLLDVHAPERRQLGGPETAAFVAGWFATLTPDRRWPLFVQTVQTRVVEPSEKMTFTRYLATVWPIDNRAPEASLNQQVRTFLSGHPQWPPGM